MITNPTHYAVAIEYRPGNHVRAGGGGQGTQSSGRAHQADRPLARNSHHRESALAQALYKTTEVGQSIPPKLYAAVAEILAFLYRAQARMLAQKPRGSVS